MAPLLSIARSCSRSNVAVSIHSLCFLLVFFPLLLHAQPTHDTKGREFWVAFMQNQGSQGDFEKSDLRLYLASDTATTAYVHYLKGRDSLVVPLVPKRTVEININLFFGDDTELDEVGSEGDNQISRKVFHITADNDVTLYGVNIRQMSGDAFLALPDDVLTGRYIIAGWPNGFLNDTPPDFDTHSEFCVIGTEDGTTVEITPVVPMSGHLLRSPFTVSLNRGEVYFGQAVLGSAFDVTGTLVKANKPVAVYSGNQRASIPLSVGNFRDHLVEQLPPIEAWGRTAILTPHYTITPRSTEEPEAQVIAAYDNTEVTITTGGRIERFILSTTSPLRLPLTASYISADRPILVLQYEHSVGPLTRPFEQAELGDPFMMLIPPPEQYDTAYSFQSILHPEYFVHYINVIVPEQAIGSLMLDGDSLADQTFIRIPGTKFSYSQIKVNSGSHYIRCDDQFGLCVYGFGPANSYGYPGGMLFRNLEIDFERPTGSISQQCHLVEGTIRDDRFTDSGIDSCFAADGIRNVQVVVDPFESGADSVHWSGRLIDPYQDGVVVVKGIDKAGRSTTFKEVVPGFTVAGEGMTGNDPLRFELVSFNGKKGCSEIRLVNYGAFPQKINQIYTEPESLPGFEVETGLPLTLLPGESTSLKICYQGGTEEDEGEISLGIRGECVDRSALVARMVSVIDTIPPSIQGGRKCGNSILTFAEPELPYLQIESIEVDSIVNGRWSIVPALPARQVQLQLEPVDFREDVVVEGRIRDRGGNEAFFFDTIPGFTLGVFDEPEEERLALRLERDWLSDSLRLNTGRCDSLLVINYGTYPLTVRRVYMRGNLNFSIPPSYLPLSIAAGERIRIPICLEGRVAGEQIDTLWIEDGCGRWENVLLRTPVKPVTGGGGDICGNLIGVQSFGPTKRTFITTPAPNPSPAGKLTIDIGLQRNEMISIGVFDMHGERQLELAENEEVEGGIHRFEFDASTLETGVYLCRMVTGSGESLTTKFVIRE